MTKRTAFVSAVAFFLFGTHGNAAWKVGVIRNGSSVRILKVEKSLRSVVAKEVLTSFPAVVREDGRPSEELFEEYLIPDWISVESLGFQKTRRDWPGSEVRTLVLQGPKENRINLTIVGDGYTLAEKDKFFQDAQRTSDQLFKVQAYASYLPLFNVYAVFVPSNQSGLGDGQPMDTALKLYRTPRGSKRAIMPGDSTAANQAVALAPATDYPILLANDDFYGGLGGQFAITTRSVRSGIVVLRHELGHNFGAVGEEYDGGYVYAGANHSDSANVPWNQWVEGALHVNEALNLGGDYMWQNLQGHPVSMNFQFPQPDTGGPYSLFIEFSSVGWETPDDVRASLDGVRKTYVGDFNDDRNFYSFPIDGNVTPGAHSLDFAENVPDGDNVLAFVRIYAFASGYDTTPGKVGAYTSYDDFGSRVGYRPTHKSCPMNDMLNPNFCAVDKENMWNRFLSRVDLVDSVTINQAQGRQVQLDGPALPGLDIRWFKLDSSGQATELPQYKNLSSWSVPNGQSGPHRVVVKFTTPEVRVYSNRYTSSKDFAL